MNFLINDSSFLEVRKLNVGEFSASFSEGVAFASTRKIEYSQIDYIVLSDANQLTIGVGTTRYTLGINPKNETHMQAVRILVQKALATVRHRMPEANML